MQRPNLRAIVTEFPSHLMSARSTNDGRKYERVLLGIGDDDLEGILVDDPQLLRLIKVGHIEEPHTNNRRLVFGKSSKIPWSTQNEGIASSHQQTFVDNLVNMTREDLKPAKITVPGKNGSNSPTIITADDGSTYTGNQRLIEYFGYTVGQNLPVYVDDRGPVTQLYFFDFRCRAMLRIFPIKDSKTIAPIESRLVTLRRERGHKSPEEPVPSYVKSALDIIANLEYRSDFKDSEIIDQVCESTGTTIQRLKENSRGGDPLVARFVISSLLQRRGLSYQQIGASIGKDHATVINSIRRLATHLPEYLREMYCSTNSTQEALE